jgi:ribosomal protein L11 methyltransferase
MKNFKAFHITFEPFNPELVSGVLWELPINGIEEQENELIVFSNNDSTKLSSLKSILNSLKKENVIGSYSISSNIIKNKNWNKEWEKSIKVIKISDTLVIKPSFRSYKAKKGEIVITIDPKMSFGTGEHETTRLMLLLLEKFVQKKMKVLDVGTGTGILAIASIKLGAAYALGIDNDEWCYSNGLENIKINSVKDKVDIRTSEIDKIKRKNFNLITANIQKNVLLNIADEFKKHLKQDGFLLLSGLLENDEKDILIKYRKLGFKLLEKMQMNEWIVLGLKLIVNY